MPCLGGKVFFIEKGKSMWEFILKSVTHFENIEESANVNRKVSKSLFNSSFSIFSIGK